ncbi:MAG: hypothetical protein R6X32_12605 [Chloroflexota bacterium]
MTMQQSVPLDAYGRSYLQLVLEIDKHIEGYIDAYYGPAELKTAVSATDKKAPAALLDDVAGLQATIPTADPRRTAYLTAALRAIDCTVRMLNGEAFAYTEEVARLYDVTPQPVAETRFEAAHRELDTLLPGQGSLAERMEVRRQRYTVEKDQILSLLELARAETRRRTAELVELPADEAVDIRLTDNQPWGAYNWYLGNGRSLIEFNTDVPTSALGLLSTFAHEGYPGHHTESMLKEMTLYRQKGYGEQAAMLLHSPAAVIAEGIATQAVDIIFPDDSHYAWTREVLLPQANLPTEETAAQMARLTQAGDQLRYVNGNAALHYHGGRLTKEQTIDYIQTYGLATPERAAKSFSFLSHPLFRSYIFTYTQGYDLIEQATNGTDKTALFHRLLTEQVLPSQLRKT